MHHSDPACAGTVWIAVSLTLSAELIRVFERAGWAK
jgi:hypothetical protein